MQTSKHPLKAIALFASPDAATALPARPTPNFFSAPRRVTDWARPLASSSNLSFIAFLSFLIWFWFAVIERNLVRCLRQSRPDAPEVDVTLVRPRRHGPCGYEVVTDRGKPVGVTNE